MRNKKEKKDKERTEWFIKPKDFRSWRSLTEGLAELERVDSELKEDRQGNEHEVYPCSWDVIKKFLEIAPHPLNMAKYEVYKGIAGGRIERVRIFEAKLPTLKLAKRAKTPIKGSAFEEQPSDPF